jgi:hypothetical protein
LLSEFTDFKNIFKKPKIIVDLINTRAYITNIDAVATTQVKATAQSLGV